MTLGAGGAAVLADLPNAAGKTSFLIGGGKTAHGQAWRAIRHEFGDANGPTGRRRRPPLVQKFPVLRHIFATPAFGTTLYTSPGKPGR